jgi:hypothetical protein
MKTALALVATLALAAPSFAKQPKQTAGGETCGTATGIPCLGCGSGDPTINFMDTGTTTGAVNDLGSIPAACGTGGGTFTSVNGPDHIYAIFIGASGTTNLTITVTPIAPDAAWDPAIYVLDTCGTASSCLAKRDANGTGLAETIPAGTFYPPGTIAIYIDSAFSVPAPEAAGNYQITVTGIIPVELMGFQVE